MNELARAESATSSWFERLLQVPAADPEQARRGRLFNLLMGLSILVALFITLIFLTTPAMTGFTAFPVALAISFPLSVTTLSLVCFGLAKRGHLGRAIGGYLVVMTLAISLASFVFDGYRSPAIILHIWSVMAAGSLLGATAALGMAALMSFWWLTLLVLQNANLYRPLFDTGPALAYVSPAFSVVVMLGGVGVISFLNLRSLEATAAGLRQTSRLLEEEHRQLEQRVEERTAQARRRAEFFQLIAELSRTLGALTELEPLLETTVRFIADRFGFYHVGLFLLDETGELVVLRAASSEGGRRMLARLHRLPLGIGVVGVAAETGLPRQAAEVGGDLVWVPNPDLPETRSELALPLAARGVIVGVLDIQSRERAAFTEETVQVLRLLADTVATALENVRLLQETRKALAELSRYREEETLKAWRAALSRQNLRLAYLYDRIAVQPVSVEQAPLPLLPPDSREVQVMPLEEGRHLLVAPVRVRDYTVGLLAFEAAHPWTEDEIRLTQGVVEQLGLALENARLLEETQRRALQERARSEIVGRVRTSVNIDAILRTVAKELGQALQVDRSRIQLLPPEEVEVSAEKP